MQATANNTFALSTPDQRQLVVLEKSSGLIRVLLVDEAGTPVQASQLSSLKLWLHLRDDTTLPVGGINSVSDTNILNDGQRGLIGNSKAITGVSVNSVDDDYRGLIRLTITGHGYSDGDLIAVRGVRGIKGANGQLGRGDACGHQGPGGEFLALWLADPIQNGEQRRRRSGWRRY